MMLLEDVRRVCFNTEFLGQFNMASFSETAKSYRTYVVLLQNFRSTGRAWCT